MIIEQLEIAKTPMKYVSMVSAIIEMKNGIGDLQL